MSEASFDTHGGFMVASGAPTFPFGVSWNRTADAGKYEDVKFAVQAPYAGDSQNPPLEILLCSYLGTVLSGPDHFQDDNARLWIWTQITYNSPFPGVITFAYNAIRIPG
jgi:hypothetical protein